MSNISLVQTIESDKTLLGNNFGELPGVSYRESVHQLCPGRLALKAHKLGIYEIHLGPLDRSHRANATYVSDEDDKIPAPS